MDRATDTNGRTVGGRFALGNKAAVGTRQAHLQKLRKAFVDCLTVNDVADVTSALVTAAKAGDVAAIKVFFERIHGRVAVEVRVDEDELSDEERREQLLSRIATLPTEAQEEIRSKLRQRKAATEGKS
jgi:hypothetical protein